MSYSTGAQFPSLNIPNSKKDKHYHQQCLQTIISRSLNTGSDANYEIIDSLYKLYDGSYDTGKFEFLTTAEDSSALPAVWQNINKVRPKIKVLLGELMERGYDFSVKAINKEARSRMLELKEQMRVDMRLAPLMDELEDYSGLPSQVEGYVPEDEEELDEFFDKNYKEEAEIVMYHALKYLDKKNKWGVKRMELFRDMLISGKAIVKNEIIRGLPVTRRIDPRFFIHDTWAEGDLLEDATYYGEIRYMNVADAMEQFNLTKEEIDQAYQSYQDYQNISSAKAGNRQHNYSFFEANTSNTFKWFKDSPKGLRILVVHACWVDYKKIKNKISKDQYGGEHFKRISDSAQDREGVTSNHIKIWRQATMIGGQILKNFGEVPNQPRDLESLAETEAPYSVVIPDFLNGRSVSLAEQLQGLQYLKDIITYRVQLDMARAGAKGFVYDTSQLPDGWEVETAIKYLKTVGIAFINSKQGGTPSQFNQFQQLDLTLSQSVAQYLDLSRWVDSEMDAITGINEARQGVVQGASQAVGVTRSALLQSSLTTAPFFKLFEEFTSKIWNTQAKLVKIAWAKKEKFAPIIGDAGVDFLSNDIDLDLNDYGVFVTETPRILDDISNFQTIVMAALQAGSLDFGDALSLLMEKDVISGIRKFEKIQQRKQEEAEQREEEMMMQQQQMEMQRQVAQNQYNEQQAQVAAQRAQEVAKAKGQADITKELVKNRGQLQQQKLNILMEQMEPNEG